jgi:hypothetical protein
MHSRPDPEIEDAGDIPGVGQGTGFDGRTGAACQVQACQLSGPQRPEQPPGLVGQFLAVAGRERGHDQVAVAVVLGSAGFGGRDRSQGGEVVGVGQVALPGLGGGQLGAVAVEHVGQDGDRFPRVRAAQPGSRGLAGQQTSRTSAQRAVPVYPATPSMASSQPSKAARTTPPPPRSPAPRARGESSPLGFICNDRLTDALMAQAFVALGA